MEEEEGEELESEEEARQKASFSRSCLPRAGKLALAQGACTATRVGERLLGWLGCFASLGHLCLMITMKVFMRAGRFPLQEPDNDVTSLIDEQPSGLDYHHHFPTSLPFSPFLPLLQPCLPCLLLYSTSYPYLAPSHDPLSLSIFTLPSQMLLILISYYVFACGVLAHAGTY